MKKLAEETFAIKVVMEKKTSSGDLYEINRAMLSGLGVEEVQAELLNLVSVDALEWRVDPAREVFIAIKDTPISRETVTVEME